MDFESELNNRYLLHLEPEVTSASYLLRNDTKISDLPDQSWFFQGSQSACIVTGPDHVGIYISVDSDHPRTVIDHFAAKKNADGITMEATLQREGENLVEVAVEIAADAFSPVRLMNIILKIMEDTHVVAD